MNSITISNEILSVDNLHLVFNLRHYQHRSVRGLFVSFLTDPINSIFKTKDSLHVIKGLNLSIKKGDRLAVIGVNGSGKTSLCRCIAGMLNPAAGKLRITGVCRAIFNTQAGIMPELTGVENARLLARFMFIDAAEEEITEIVREATEFTELGHFLDAPYETYSAGMKARLCLSIVTAKTADLLILDEVYDSTDQFFQKKMTARLKAFIEHSGAVIFVSHSEPHIREICNRAIVLRNQTIAYDGNVEGALAAYTDGASE